MTSSSPSPIVCMLPHEVFTWVYHIALHFWWTFLAYYKQVKPLKNGSQLRKRMHKKNLKQVPSVTTILYLFQKTVKNTSLAY